MPLRLTDCWRPFLDELHGEPDEWETGCAIARHDLAAFFEGNLSSAGMLRLAEHLERCAHCDEAFTAFAAERARSCTAGRADAPPRA